MMVTKKQRQEKQKANPVHRKNWDATTYKKPSADVYSDKARKWDESDPYQPPICPGEDGISRIINGEIHSFCSQCGWRSKADGYQHTTKEHRAVTKAQPGKFKSKHRIFRPDTDQPPSKPEAAASKPVTTSKPRKSNESKKKSPPIPRTWKRRKRNYEVNWEEEPPLFLELEGGCL